jgi:hypothetical protein
MSAVTTTIYTKEQAKASDAKLVELMQASSQARSRLRSLLDGLHRSADDDYRRRYDSRSGWKMTDEEAIAKVQAKIAAAEPVAVYDDGPVYIYHIREAMERLEKLASLESAVEDAETAVLTQQQEWWEHGMWNRYGVVPGGHIHHDHGCFTLRITTPFMWAYELSGESVEEAIEAYGPALCSHCFKDAPSEYQQKGKVPQDADGNPMTRAEAQAIKDAKAAEKAAKLAAKNAAAVIDPETGKVLFKTDRGATNAVASDLESAIWYGPTHPQYPEWIALLDRVSAALGAKQNRPASEVRAELVAKAEKKAKAPLGGKKSPY